jgi:hypothetical protein
MSLISASIISKIYDENMLCAEETANSTCSSFIVLVALDRRLE